MSRIAAQKRFTHGQPKGTGKDGTCCVQDIQPLKGCYSPLPYLLIFFVVVLNVLVCKTAEIVCPMFKRPAVST
eukprot:363067-Chlamydomonas_euryale.AAC.8